MSTWIFLVISLFLVGIQTAIPFLVKKTVIFGVTIPELFIKEEKLTIYKRRYVQIVLALSTIIIGAYTIWVLANSPTEEFIVLGGTVIQFGIIFISMSLYFYFHGKVSQFKKEQKFVENLKQVQVTDLSIRSQDEMLPWYVYLLPIIVSVGLIGYTILQYEILPQQIPTHWGINGEADAFTSKTLFSVITMPLMLLILQLMFLGTNFATKRSGIKLSATSTNASRIRQLSLRKYSSWFMFLTTVLMTMLFSYFQLTTIHPNLIFDKAMLASPFIFLILILVGSIAFAIKVGRADKQTFEEPESGITDLDEDGYWKGGLFYFNKSDPSIFVEKRFGVGWTMNFANPMGYLIIIVPLVIILFIAFL